MTVTVEEIRELVDEIDGQDPVDWAMLAIDESAATELIVNQLVDSYNITWSKFDQDTRDRIMLASMAKLVIENFVLNVRLHQQ